MPAGVQTKPWAARGNNASQSGKLAHRVIVGVVVGRGAIIAEQGGNRLSSIGGIRQQADSLFVGLIRHHVGSGDVAIMAAEAEQDSADFSAAAGDAGGQGLSIFAAVAESDGFAIEWAGVLSPQCVATGIGAPP